MTAWYIFQFCIFLCGRHWYHLLVCSAHCHRPWLIWEKFVNLKFVLFFNSWWFSHGNNETQKQSFVNVLQNRCFYIFTGKHLWIWSLFLIKLQVFFIEHLWWLLLETWTYNPLTPRKKSNYFLHTDSYPKMVIFHSRNQKVLNSSLIINMIHVHARFSSIVLN